MEKATAHKPKSQAPVARDASLGYGLRRSLFVHAALITFVILKSLFFPSSEKPYTPALKVDVVDLPDLLKMEKMRIGSLPEPEPAPPEADKAPESKEEESPPVDDEMVLAKKKAAEKEAEEKKKLAEAERRKKEEERREEELEKKRKKNMSSALARIKALNKITETPVEAPEQFKGNKISKGAAIDGDARETDEPSYYDLVHQRIKDNWELPVWLDRMQLSAKVRITIDSRGNVRSMVFAKTSGNARFDQAVKDAITKAQPFPAPTAAETGTMITNGILLGFPL